MAQAAPLPPTGGSLGVSFFVSLEEPELLGWWLFAGNCKSPREYKERMYKFWTLPRTEIIQILVLKKFDPSVITS